MKDIEKKEFYQIISPILQKEEFQRLNERNHHGISRYTHSFRVAYYTYFITKRLHLRYQEATVAAMLHDFFTDEVEQESKWKRLIHHPQIAYQNASKYFSLNELQEDIIKKHMFPVTFLPPKYLESWIVDIVDDCCAIREQAYTVKRECRAAASFLLFLFLHIVSPH